MSSGTAIPPQGAIEPSLRPPGQGETFIDDRLKQTRRQVKGVDIVGGLIVLLIAALAYLLVVVVIDHWVVSGGLGFWGRFLLLMGMLGGGGYYVWRGIVPALIGRVNPIYAAHTIEKSRPSLKNSVINFLLLRADRHAVSPVIYQALEERAAADLSHVQIEVAVDRTHVIRLGYVLAGVVAICCLYMVLSSKSLFASAARVAFPWADIKAPTRVTIDDVQPGRVTKFHGDEVTVSALIKGLDDDETAGLYYSAADGQFAAEPLTMTRSKGELRFRRNFPPGGGGLQQDHQYYLVAGDCRTEPFSIRVEIPPAIRVQQISYDYPAYTGIADRTVQGNGDIRAIEGTKITIRAKANQAIKRASIDLGCDGRPGPPMQAKGQLATGGFPLRITPREPFSPEFDSYRLRFTDEQGRTNRRPTRHEIEVIRDLPPEVRVIDPQQQQVQVTLDGQLEIRVRAWDQEQDHDGGLRSVIVRAEHEGRRLTLPVLLSRLKPQQPWQDEFAGTCVFQPLEHRLKPGDRVSYWVEAEDNKEPEAGRGKTEPGVILIVDPTDPNRPAPQPAEQPRQQPPPNSDQRQPDPNQRTNPAERNQRPPNDQPQDPQATDDQQQEQPGDQGSTGQGQGGEGEEGGQDERTDPDTQMGDAIEKIMEHRNEQQQKEQQGEQPQPEEQPGEQQQTGGEPGEQQTGGEPGEQQQTGSEPREQQTGGEPGEQEQTGGEPGEQQTGGEPGEQKQTGGEPAGEQQAGGEPGEQKQTGGEPAGEQQTGGEPGEQQQTGGDPSDPGGKGQTAEPADRQPPVPRESPGSGDDQGEEQKGSPEAQEDNQQRTDQEAEEGKGPDSEPGEEKSPGIGEKQSRNQKSESQGDRPGDGNDGGGQQANRPGQGPDGSNTDAEEGGSASQQQGEGETGDKGGDHEQTDQQTGNSAKSESGGDRTGQPTDVPEGQQSPDSESPPKTPSDQPGTPTDPGEGGEAGDETGTGPSTQGTGRPTGGGGEPGKQSEPKPPPPAAWQDNPPNLDHAKEQSVLALEHLKDQAEREDSELMKKLGWTDEDRKRFQENLQRMLDNAKQNGQEGDQAKRRLENLLRGLDFGSSQSEVQTAEGTADQMRNLREGRFYEPPPKYSDYFKAHKRGVAQGGNEDAGR